MALFGKSEFTEKIESGYNWLNKSDFFRDYYESMRGKRDRWAWFYGFIVPLAAILWAFIEYKRIAAQNVPNRVMEAFYMYRGITISLLLVICISFFFGKRWSRKAMFAIPFLTAIVFHLIMGDVLTSQAMEQITGEIIGRGIIGLLIYTAVITLSVPNMAFFEIPISEKQIERYWGAKSNKYAKYAAIVGVLSPFMVAALLNLSNAFEIIEVGSAAAKLMVAMLLYITTKIIA